MGCYALITALGSLLAAQAIDPPMPRFEFEDFLDEGRGISVTFHTVLQQKWVTLEEDALVRLKKANFNALDVYYEYEEETLNPDADHGSAIFIYLVKDAGPPARAFLRKYKVQVEGTKVEAIVDIQAQLAAEGQPDEVIETATIQLPVHRSYPDGALTLAGRKKKGDELVVETRGQNSRKLRLTNNTPFDIELLGSFEVRSEAGSSVWASEPKLKLIGRNMIEAGKTVEGFELSVTPNSRSAFLSSLWPYRANHPHAKLDVRIPFRLPGGRTAEIRATLPIRFEPHFPLVVAAAFLGGLVAALASYLGQDQIRRNWKVLGQRAAFSGLIALVFFLLYYFVKGERDVVFFDLPIEPTQILPAVIFGFVVGMRPSHWLSKIPGWSHLPLLVVAVVLVCDQSYGRDFEPIQIEYEPESDELFVFTRNNEVFLVDRSGAPRLRLLNELDSKKHSKDYCVLRIHGRSFFASVTSGRSSSLDRTWQNRITLTPYPFGRQSPETAVASPFIKLTGIGCDSGRSRLILTGTDSFRSGRVLEVNVQPDGSLSSASPVLRRPMRIPIPVVLAGGLAYVGDVQRHAVFAINLETRTAEKILDDIETPLGLALSRDGRKLFIADGGGGKVVEYRIRSGSSKTLYEGAELRQPTGVAVTPDGLVWISDSIAEAIILLKKSSRGFMPTVLKPTN